MQQIDKQSSDSLIYKSNGSESLHHLENKTQQTENTLI